jgi:DNA repair protein RecO
MARNSISSRRFGGTLEPGVASLWYFVEKPGSELVRIEETEIRKEFTGIRKSLERLSASAWLCELIMVIAPEREPVPEIFRLLANALTWLDETPESELRFKFGHFLNLTAGKVLQLSGTQPRIAACEICRLPIEGAPPEVGYRGAPEKASLICTGCRPGGGQVISPSALADLLRGLALPIRKALEGPGAPGRQHLPLFNFLEELLMYHVPGFDPSKIKSRKMLLTALEEVNRGGSS